MNVLKGALLPVGCALLQTVSVGTGLPDRSPGSAAVAALLGVASGVALFARGRAPFVVLAVTVAGDLAQVLVGGPALPVAVSVMAFVVGRGYTIEGRSPAHSPTLIAVALLGALIGVVAPLQMAGLDLRPRPTVSCAQCPVPPGFSWRSSPAATSSGATSW